MSKWPKQLTIPTMPTTTNYFDFADMFLEILKHNLSFINAVQDIKFNYSKRLGKITTTVLFKDGTKSTVAPKDGEFFDPQTGIEQAILKRFCGLSRSAYKKWLDNMSKKSFDATCDMLCHMCEENKDEIADHVRTELKPETAMAYPIRSCTYCRFKDVSALQYPCSECGNDKLRWEPEKDVNLFDGD